MNDELRAAFGRLDRALQDARAACAAAGVPCPEEEKPKTVTVAHGAGTMRFDRLTAIAAKLTAEDKPGLFVVGAVCGTDGATFTTTPLADIRAQAAAAGIELPEVTVDAQRRWTAITKVTVAVASSSEDPLVYSIHGEADGGPVKMLFSPYTPAQVCRLCALAGWPKPEVRMVLTHCDGDPCTVDPCEDIVVEYDARWHATSIAWVPSPRDDGYEDADEDHIVREPVAVVEAMRDACKEGE